MTALLENRKTPNEKMGTYNKSFYFAFTGIPVSDSFRQWLTKSTTQSSNSASGNYRKPCSRTGLYAPCTDARYCVSTNPQHTPATTYAYPPPQPHTHPKTTTITTEIPPPHTTTTQNTCHKNTPTTTHNNLQIQMPHPIKNHTNTTTATDTTHPNSVGGSTAIRSGNWQAGMSMPSFQTVLRCQLMFWD